MAVQFTARPDRQGGTHCPRHASSQENATASREPGERDEAADARRVTDAPEATRASGAPPSEEVMQMGGFIAHMAEAIVVAIVLKVIDEID